MTEKFKMGDTILLYNIIDEEFYKGFYHSVTMWGVDGKNYSVTFNYKEDKRMIHMGLNYSHRNICNCRIVLSEKKIKW